ncbi:ABC transporter permease [Tersicoccus solisilvae]|uniref:ABC transporter permease n=1 Tax=Tersicoccus solisilvae TaxID=1882339 RepID=A0ABQ1NJZ7_9MICC|nr:ABC transporter permease [Tersicoccus solisilvae]GGC79116.1 ABC transporter permease [Tersicoccus solisilvae]
MSAATSTHTPAHRAAGDRPGAGPSFGRVLSAETIKFFGLRSTWVLLIVTVVLMVGFAALSAWAIASFTQDSQSGGANGPGGPGGPGAGGATDFVHTVPSSGLSLAILVLGAMGAMFVAGEIGNRSILATMTAVPARWPVLVAKAIVLTVVSWVTITVCELLGYLVAQPLLAPADLDFAFDATRVPQIIFLSGLYAAAIAVMGLGLGALIRNTAAAIVVLVAILLVFPILVAIFQQDWVQWVSAFLPSTAHDVALNPTAEGKLDAAGSWAVIAGWPVVLLGAGIALIQSRDV